MDFQKLEGWGGGEQRAGPIQGCASYIICKYFADMQNNFMFGKEGGGRAEILAQLHQISFSPFAADIKKLAGS